MKRILIVAHPGDELSWFGGGRDFDKICFVFLYNPLYPEMEKRRWKAINNHPFKDKIEVFGLVESNYQKDEKNLDFYKKNFDGLTKRLRWMVDKNAEFWTHNVWGNNGNFDHILVSEAVTELAENLGIGVRYDLNLKIDEELCNQLKVLYSQNRIITCQ